MDSPPAFNETLKLEGDVQFCILYEFYVEGVVVPSSSRQSPLTHICMFYVAEVMQPEKNIKAILAKMIF